MAAPVIVSVSPADQATGLVTGLKIVVTFDQLIDPASFSNETFLLRGPGDAILITPDQLATDTPNFALGSEAIAGTFSVSTTEDGLASVITFDPGQPLAPNTTYTCLVIGAGAILTQDAVRNLAAEPLAANYQWTFSTGYLDTKIPPPQSPIAVVDSTLDPIQVSVLPQISVGADLSQKIVLTFPDDIDPDAFNAIKDNILISISPILNDPMLPDLSRASSRAVINGRRLEITINIPS